MDRILKVGIVQMGSVKDKESNLSKIARFMSRCSADVVVIPEYSMFPLSDMTPEEAYMLAEPLDGPYLMNLSKLAVEHSVYLIATLFERANYPKVFNVATLISPSGNILGVYRKTHLFDAYNYSESKYMVAGDKLSPILDIKGVKTALAICFDLRFPEVFRSHALSGAEVIFTPSAWYGGSLKEEVYISLARARASENTVYLVIANQYSREFIGRSLIVDPLGVILCDLGIGEKYLEFPIDVDFVHEVRRSLPLLNLRRRELYQL